MRCKINIPLVMHSTHTFSFDPVTPTNGQVLRGAVHVKTTSPACRPARSGWGRSHGFYSSRGHAAVGWTQCP
jgi:hypothetical protein